MATTAASKPRNWEQKDPGEQWDAAVAAATKELEVENSNWQFQTRREIEDKVLSEARRKYDRVKLLLVRIGYTLLSLLVLAVAVWGIWMGIQNTNDKYRDDRVRQEWIVKCTQQEGVVYQQAGSGLGAVPLLCVTGGKVIEP